MPAYRLIRKACALTLAVALVAIGMVVRPEAAEAVAANKLVASGSTTQVLCTTGVAEACS